MIRLGVDVGGTFTDLVLTDDSSGAIHVNKVPTTPQDPSIGTMAGAMELCEIAGISPAHVAPFFPGTTIPTNLAPAHIEDDTDRLTLHLLANNEITNLHVVKNHVVRNENTNVAIIIPTIINTPFIFMYII